MLLFFTIFVTVLNIFFIFVIFKGFKSEFALLLAVIFTLTPVYFYLDVEHFNRYDGSYHQASHGSSEYYATKPAVTLKTEKYLLFAEKPSESFDLESSKTYLFFSLIFSPVFCSAILVFLMALEFQKEYDDNVSKRK